MSIQHILGLDTQNSAWYLYYSGIGPHLWELATLGSLIGFLHRHTCHVHRCYRIGKYPVADFMVCRRHHPDDAPRAEDVRHASEG